MSIRIFIADDHPVFRSGLRALLEKESDLEVVGEAGNGVDTIRAVDKGGVDILILDINMPGMPGARVAESLLKRRPKLGIVVLTMHDDEYYLQEMFRIGARAFVLKKATATDLVQAIRAVDRGELFIDSSLTSTVIASYVGRQDTKGVRLEILSPREQEICALLAYGYTNAEIAQRLYISERTVETHRNKIQSKLNLKSRVELVRFAIDNGLLRLT
jgi:DNA-binding NarL/FixJ family response regulator